MEKVTYKGVQSATVRTDNSVDPERAYDIAASVNINGTAVGSVDGGEVRKKGEQAVLASFASYGENNLNVGYQGVTSEEQCTINTAINAFITDVKVKASTDSPVS